MKFPVIAIAIVAGLFATSCAKGPDAIAPASIPLAAYTGKSCKSIRSDLAAERATLASLEKTQREAQAGDAIGVFLIGVPISSVAGGDKEGALSVSKG